MAGKVKIGRALPRAAIGFLPEFLDFKKGIRVGNLEDNQRITRILKLALEDAYRESFVTERFGRGVYWMWIGFVSRCNRAAKPVSSNVSFGCAKFYVTMDFNDRLFKCGFSVERGFVNPPPDFPAIGLKPDWDWHRLLKQLKSGSPLEHELRRLVGREGFCIEAGNWDHRAAFRKNTLPSADKLKKILKTASPEEWAGFQVYYPMTKKDISETSGVDLIESMLAVFREVTPAMNQCMQVSLNPGDGRI